MDLAQLAKEAWTLHSDPAVRSCVVKPSVPVLYFGDHRRYSASPRRIVTVGLNPSKAEFPADDPFARFRNARPAYERAGLDDWVCAAYLSAMDGYFQGEPYRMWFDQSYRHILAGMDASFYGDRAAVALHTDLCSPVPTDPTWSGLNESKRLLMMARGLKLWAKLMDYLQPDLAIASIKKEYLGYIPFRVVSPLGDRLCRPAGEPL